MSPSAKQRNAWKVAALKYAIPNLSGQWHVLNRALILQPSGLVARGVGADDYSLIAVLEPLFMPLSYQFSGWQAAIGFGIPDPFPYYTLKDGERPAEEYMLRLAAVVNETILPHVAKHGSLEGYYEYCQQLNAVHATGVGDPHTLYQQAATAIVLRRPEDAEKALDDVQKGIDLDPTDDREWVRDLYAQAGELRERLITDPAAVREDLLSGVDEQKRRRKLPPTG